MIVIVEGPRASGKTTFCKSLVNQLTVDGLMAKYTKFPRGVDPFSEMLLQLDEMAKEPTTFFVIDRFHLTEYVMRSLDHRVPVVLLDRGISVIDERLKELQAVVFVIMPSEEVRQERLTRRNDGRPDEGEEVNLRYYWKEAIQRWFVDYVIGDEADHNLGEITLLFARFLESVHE